MKRPSDKQIICADKIAEKLNLSFPRGDYDFTAKAYYDFISDHIQSIKKHLILFLFLKMKMIYSGDMNTDYGSTNI